MSIASAQSNDAAKHIRPLNILRDLPSVADLIETCFSSTMDSEGRSYIRQMRETGRDNSFLRWADHINESTSLPLSGYVWEENGKIIGNVSLIPFRHQKQKIFLLANVATNPDNRRRGIAHHLTKHSLLMARQKNADAIWLHVRDDNDGAIQLYKDLGFVERARRTTYQAKTDPLLILPKTDVMINKRIPAYWPEQRAWLNRLHPDELAWHRNWNWKSFEPGLLAWLYRLFTDYEVQQWAAVKQNSLQATLTWMPGVRQDTLWAATKPNMDTPALEVLLMNARKVLAHRHTLSVEHPAQEYAEQFISAGFAPQRTLLWMYANGATY